MQLPAHSRSLSADALAHDVRVDYLAHTEDAQAYDHRNKRCCFSEYQWPRKALAFGCAMQQIKLLTLQGIHLRLDFWSAFGSRARLHFVDSPHRPAIMLTGHCSVVLLNAVIRCHHFEGNRRHHRKCRRHGGGCHRFRKDAALASHGLRLGRRDKGKACGEDATKEQSMDDARQSERGFLFLFHASFYPNVRMV